MRLPASFPELATLELFCSVIQLGGLSRAAQAHGIAQPSASARIRKLERQLGVPLLNRTPNGSVPTPAGVLVGEWSATVLAAAAELAAGADALRAHQGGRLRLAASYTVAEYLLPAWLARFKVDHQAPIELEVVNSTRVLELVRSARADLGFIESPGDAGGLACCEIGGDLLTVVVAPEHPWARRRAPLTPAALASATLVSREPGSGTRDALEGALRALDLELASPTLELGSTTAVKAAVISGSGPAVLSGLAVEAELAAGRLVAVRVDDLDLSRRLRAVWRSGAVPEGSAATFLALARRSAGISGHGGPGKQTR